MLCLKFAEFGQLLETGLINATEAGTFKLYQEL